MASNSTRGNPPRIPGNPAEHFDAMYAEGLPPWEIGRPQPEFVALASSGRISGSVLDSGCGTGENALMLAARGLQVVGVDISPMAISRARQKAVERELDVRFEVHDVLDLPSLDFVARGGKFRSILDSGVFHVFDDASRAKYVRSLGAALEPGGRLFMLVFSDQEPGDWGPRRITQAEIREAFKDGWEIEEIVPARFDTLLDRPPVKAWRATIRRTTAGAGASTNVSDQ